MKNYLSQPQNLGFGLFGLAASILFAIIAANVLGWNSALSTLNSIAQPLCAAAISTLTYLAVIARRFEKSQAELS